MVSNRMLTTLLLSAVVFSVTAHAADKAIRIGAQDGKPVAQFTVGDSDCVLKDDRIQCTPNSR